MKNVKYRVIKPFHDADGHNKFVSLEEAMTGSAFAVLNLWGHLATSSVSSSALFDSREEADEYIEYLIKEIGSEVDYYRVLKVKTRDDIIAFPENDAEDYAYNFPEDKKSAGVAEKVLQAAAKALGAIPYTGGCNTYYTVDKWKERKEEFGLNSELIICHDGGDFASLCNWSYCDYGAMDRFQDELKKYGYYVEQCTCWYSAVYKI